MHKSWCDHFILSLVQHTLEATYSGISLQLWDPSEIQLTVQMRSQQKDNSFQEHGHLSNVRDPWTLSGLLEPALRGLSIMHEDVTPAGQRLWKGSCIDSTHWSFSFCCIHPTWHNLLFPMAPHSHSWTPPWHQGMRPPYWHALTFQLKHKNRYHPSTQTKGQSWWKLIPIKEHKYAFRYKACSSHKQEERERCVFGQMVNLLQSHHHAVIWMKYLTQGHCVLIRPKMGRNCPWDSWEPSLGHLGKWVQTSLPPMEKPEEVSMFAKKFVRKTSVWISCDLFSWEKKSFAPGIQLVNIIAGSSLKPVPF